MEHYDVDNQNRLHCYEENSQGPCEFGKLFIQPDEYDENGALKNPTCSTDFGTRGVFSGPEFETKCNNGKRYDKTTNTCKTTTRHGNRTKKRPIGGQKNVLIFLRRKKRHY